MTNWQRLRRFARIGLILSLILVPAGYALNAWVGITVQTQTLQPRGLQKSIVATGRVETPHRVELAAQITGTVSAVKVVEGQTVTAGTPLIELDAAELQAAQEIAQASVEQAQAKIEQITRTQRPVADQQLRVAEVTQQTARSQLDRFEALFGQGFIGAATLENANQTAQTAQLQVAVAQFQRSSLAPGGSDWLLAQAALRQAQASLRNAQARRNYSTVRAPSAGSIIARRVEPGDVVQPGRALLTLAPTGPTQLIVLVDEKNLGQLALEQKALASADAYPSEVFPAILKTILPGVDPQTATVEVRFEVPNAPHFLRQNMTVSVEVLTALRTAAIAVPTTALIDIAAQEASVLVIEKHRVVRKSVRLGLSSTPATPGSPGAQTEVLEGLQTGEEIILEPRGLKPGQRVRSTSQPARTNPGAHAAVVREPGSNDEGTLSNQR